MYKLELSTVKLYRYENWPVSISSFISLINYIISVMNKFLHQLQNWEYKNLKILFSHIKTVGNLDIHNSSMMSSGCQNSFLFSAFLLYDFHSQGQSFQNFNCCMFTLRRKEEKDGKGNSARASYLILKDPFWKFHSTSYRLMS